MSTGVPRLPAACWKECIRIAVLCTTLWVYAITPSAAQPQTGSDPIIEEVLPPGLALKWSAMHLFYFYPSWQFSVEHRLLKKLNLQYEAGWVVPSLQNVPEYQDKRGYRVAAEVRYYLPSPRMLPFFVSAEFYYHKIRFDRTETVGFNCGGGACDYFQSVTYPVDTNELGPGLKFGFLLFPGWKRNRSFFFDFNSGIAFRSISYISTGRPSGEGMEYFQEGGGWLTFSPDEEITERPRLIMGVRFCYRFI